MQTSELINQLARQLPPVQRHALWQRLVAWWLLGIALALLVLMLTVGVRADLRTAMQTFPFWMKWLYTGSFSIVGLALSARLARPDAKVGWMPYWLGVPWVLLLMMALHDWQQAPAAMSRQMWLGHSALMCPWNIAGLAVPVFITVALVLRRLAPTRLRLAGFAAGCLAGASGATVYALLCNESAAPFIVVWYTLGMLLPALIGGVFGPRLLRW